jgi:hypothetical protein
MSGRILPNHLGVPRVTPPLGPGVLPLLPTMFLSGIPAPATTLRRRPTLGPGNLLDLLLEILLGILDIDHGGVQ